MGTEEKGERREGRGKAGQSKVGPGKGDLISSACSSPWYKFSQHGGYQASTAKPLIRELGSIAYNRLPNRNGPASDTAVWLSTPSCIQQNTPVTSQ